MHNVCGAAETELLLFIIQVLGPLGLKSFVSSDKYLFLGAGGGGGPLRLEFCFVRQLFWGG